MSYNVLVLIVYLLVMVLPGLAAAGQTEAAKLPPPMDGSLKYPFEKESSMRCGHWKSGSQDYPWFGAPRNRNKRSHAGIDIYPAGGPGTRVVAIKSGLVIKIAPFYIRANCEVTYGVLVDHGGFTANYAELRKPDVTVSSRLEKGQVIGRVSGTGQLHFELYAGGTRDWTRGWYGQQPSNLLDPTDMMLKLLPDGG